MKRNRLSRIEADSAGVLDISSLVDICFLLLIYFIVTSVITPAERDLPMGPPATDTIDRRIELDSLTINIDALGQIFVEEGTQKMPMDLDADSRELPLLEDRLRIYQQAANALGERCLVVIDAHDEVRTQRVVDVLNTLAGLEIKNVSFSDPLDE